MSSQLIVPIAKVSAVKEHPNADKLEIAEILGWNLVVGKDNGYTEGQRVVYVPPDSVLPEELSDKLDVTKYLSNGRVRAARLRGEPSYGLTIPIHMLPEDMQELSEGTDVSSYFGITKYEAPLRPDAGDAEVDHPGFYKYTDIDNLRNFPHILQDGEPVVLTEKVHGTNSRVGIVSGGLTGGILMAGSHKLRRKKPETEEAMRNNPYWFPLTLEPVKQLLQFYGKHGHDVILFGEVYGPKVQNLAYGVSPSQLGYAAFDIMIDGKYVDYSDFMEICKHTGISPVPSVVVNAPYSLDLVKAHSGGNTFVAGGQNIKEGVVIRPMKERHDPTVGRVIFKYHSDEWLTSKKSDYKEV